MSIQIIATRGKVEPFKHNNLGWTEAEEFLQKNANKNYEEVNVMVFTDTPDPHKMPIDDCTVKTTKEAEVWLHKTFDKLIKGKYNENINTST